MAPIHARSARAMATTTWGAFCPAGDALPIALPQADLGLPPARVARLGHLLQAAWAMATDRGGRAGRPGAFAQGPAGRGVARLGDAARPAPLARRVFRGRYAQGVQARSGVLDARAVPECGYRRPCHRA